MFLVALWQRLDIETFILKNPHGKPPRKKRNVCLSFFVTLDQIPKIKIFHMVVSEHPKVIERRWRLIDPNVLDSEEAAEDGSIDNDGAALNEDYESGLGDAGVRTVVTLLGTEGVEEVQQVVKSSSLLSYMFKLPYLLTQGFNRNKKTQEKLFKYMCNVGSRAEWKNGRRAVSFYIDVDISNDQYRLVNPTPLDCIIGYIIKYTIIDMYLKRFLI